MTLIVPPSRKTTTPRNLATWHGPGPFIEQSEETTIRKFHGVPCVFVPREPYYLTSNNRTRPLSDAGRAARERWLLKLEEGGLENALPGDI